jgi:catechol 2,3-dioxygenase-like lactoylglutathione lyase family enzyme
VATPRRSLVGVELAAESHDDLDRLAAAMQGAGHHVVRGSERVEVGEPATGVRVGVEVAAPLQVEPRQLPSVNTPAASARLDRPAEAVLRDDDPVEVSNLTHLALVTPDLDASLRFFTDLLGFEVSDQLPGVVAFTRCGELHHTLALQQGAGALLHHVAFEVDGVDDVARGGSRMIAAHADRHVWGLGRHAIGSNWFWYLREPGGHYVEYTADIDRVTAQERYEPKRWTPRELLYAVGPPPPPEFLEPPDAPDLPASG